MVAPFLRLLQTTSSGSRSIKVILAASGPRILCFSSADGSLLSQWTHASPSKAVSSQGEDDNDGPPAKRRRLSEDEDDVSDAPSAEVLVENGSTEKPRRNKRKPKPLPSVIKLCVSSNGRYVVAVTGEDKSIRVLELVDGQLRQLSQRQMPKKPSAITLDHNQKSILVADKFGDVYSLPLIFDEKTVVVDKTAEVEAKPYKPSATNLTVHTKKNLKALEQQLMAKPTDQKKIYAFDHTLILGHVSLLTDLLTVIREVDGQKRSYLLTSDRDEHIRITRGVPQSHVIEQFCLGHTSFVNKLLVPRTRPDILISGGGDDYVLIWDWLHGKEVGRASLLEHVSSVRMSLLSIASEPETPGQSRSDDSKIAASGLWALPWQSRTDKATSTEIIIACEAVPSLLVFSLEGNSLHHEQNIPLDGNPLDVIWDKSSRSILVSVDNIHRPGSLSETEKAVTRPFIQSFTYSVDNGNWLSGGDLSGVVHDLNEWAQHCAKDENDLEDSAISDLLYGIEHLRKRVGADPEEEG